MVNKRTQVRAQSWISNDTIRCSQIPTWLERNVVTARETERFSLPESTYWKDYMWTQHLPHTPIFAHVCVYFMPTSVSFDLNRTFGMRWAWASQRWLQLLSCICIFRRVKSTPDPDTSEMYRNTPPISTAIVFAKHAAPSWLKEVYTRPISITIRLPFASPDCCRSIMVRGHRHTLNTCHAKTALGRVPAPAELIDSCLCVSVWYAYLLRILCGS